LVPDLVFAESASALLGYVRAGALSDEEAHAKLELLSELPLKIASLRSLAVDALERARGLGLSVYDACYVVLADAADATLVTADRRLARAAPRASLLPAAGPPGE
jgi:predicted nucleic acid-binding protein